MELLLEFASGPEATALRKALFKAETSALTLESADIKADFTRLSARVKFHGEVNDYGPTLSVVFEDGCGNLVQLVQFKAKGE